MPDHPRQAEGGLEPQPVADVGGLVVLDRTTPVPLWYQIARQLAAAIETHRLRGGLRLPSQTQLAACWHVSQPTVRHALEVLVAQSLVLRRTTGIHVVRD
jgi:DNA-binding GntR family transcriptional regulator